MIKHFKEAAARPARVGGRRGNRHHTDKPLERAEVDGKVLIRRRDGGSFALAPERPPFDGGGGVVSYREIVSGDPVSSYSPAPHGSGPSTA